MLAADDGRRPRFDAPISTRTRLFRTGAIAVVVTLVALPLTSAGSAAVDRLATSAQTVLPFKYQPVAISAVAAEPSTSAIAHYEPDNAVDGTISRAWAIAWRGGEPPADCGGSTSPALVLTLAEPSDVSRIIVNAGLDPADRASRKQAAPKTLDIGFLTGACTRVNLAQGIDDQEFAVDGAGASGAVVQIVDVYPPVGGPAEVGTPTANESANLSALSEIRLFQG